MFVKQRKPKSARPLVTSRLLNKAKLHDTLNVDVAAKDYKTTKSIPSHFHSSVCSSSNKAN